MAKYIVLLNVENVVLEWDGVERKSGFYTFRFVEAPDPRSAGDVALRLLRCETDISDGFCKPAEERPVMTVDDIEELDGFPPDVTAGGRIWYEMRPKRWWQFWRRAGR